MQILSFELCTTSVSDVGNKKAWQRRPATVMRLWHIFSCLNLISLRQEFVQIFKMAKCPMHGIFPFSFACFIRQIWSQLVLTGIGEHENKFKSKLSRIEEWRILNLVKISLQSKICVNMSWNCWHISNCYCRCPTDTESIWTQFLKFKYLWNSLEILSIAPNIPLSLWEPIDLDFSISCDMFGTNLET